MSKRHFTADEFTRELNGVTGFTSAEFVAVRAIGRREPPQA